MQKEQWNEKSFKITQKTAHQGNLVGMGFHSPDVLLTSADDATVRMWDLRLSSSVKLIRNKCLTENISNPQSDGQNGVYIASQSSLYLFDARKELVFVEQVKKTIEEPHYDEISRIKFDRERKEILCCDDQGDIRIYKQDSLECIHRLEQEHKNICNSIDIAKCQNKNLKEKKLCVSGGFDSTLILWDMEEEIALKKIPIQEIFAKYQIKSQNQNMPFIHSLFSYRSSVLVGLQTGHIICFPLYQLRKPKFILQASLNRIVCCNLWEIGSKNMLLSADNADSFCLFDFDKRVNGNPSFLQKYKTIGEPVQIEGSGANILVATATPTLSIYQMKQ